MNSNPVLGWVLDLHSSGRLSVSVATLTVSIVGSAGVAHSRPIPPNESHPTIAQISPVPMPRFDRPVLRVGSQGEDVSQLQGILKLLGFYSGMVNGVYDNLTAQAVTQFQQAAGLKPDGVVGLDTWNLLLPSAVEPTPPPPSPCNCSPGVSSGDLPVLQFGMRGTAVVALQRRLQAQGFFSGIVDGIFGSETENAVRSAQLSYNLTANGVVDSRLWDAILR
ncbi:MAG: peptidoglycan-binding protein [Cyanobacteria bacterium J055]|nr:MAG: peptidoglycan-binding protein [Cyanobacteria bacterium J055]